MFQLRLGNSMIVIFCRDSWSTIMMMIVLSYYCDSSRHGIEEIFVFYINQIFRVNFGDNTVNRERFTGLKICYFIPMEFFMGINAFPVPWSAVFIILTL